MSPYILESELESDRLERQSQSKNYDYRLELSAMKLPTPARVLDAGCGSGVILRYLAERFPRSQLMGCDSSDLRLAFARQTCKTFSQITLQKADLTALPFEEGQFDMILCRYVLQHIPRDQVLRVVQEAYRCLRPGGEFWVIDCDGTLINLYPQPPQVSQILIRLEAEGLFEFRMGRKVKSLLHLAGFKNFQGTIESLDFSSKQSLLEEVKMTRERLENAQGFLERYLGSIEAARNFNEEFLKAMQLPEAYYFYDKVIVKGVKPRPSALASVKGGNQNASHKKPKLRSLSES